MKLKTSCDICGSRIDYEKPSSNRKQICCEACLYPNYGNRLCRVFGFFEYEDAAAALDIPVEIFHKLNGKPGRNLRSIADIVVHFARQLDLDTRLLALTHKCPWTKLSNRCLELFRIENLARMTSVFHMSQSILSDLNRGKGSPAITALMKLAINLAEHMTPAMRSEFRGNTWLYID